MLTKIEANTLTEELQREQKIQMKNILNYAKMALDDSKFDLFKRTVFNAFGVSGLQKSTETSINKYVGE